jgi:hypothetical protein
MSTKRSARRVRPTYEFIRANRDRYSVKAHLEPSMIALTDVADYIDRSPIKPVATVI